MGTAYDRRTGRALAWVAPWRTSARGRLLQGPARLTGGAPAPSAPSCGRPCPPSLSAVTGPTWARMFSVDEATAAAIRRAYDEGGELAGAVEFKRHFPLISDNAKARECARIIAGWSPVPDEPSPVRLRRRSIRDDAARGRRSRQREGAIER